MSKHFKVLGFLANCFPQVAFSTICSGAVASTKIEVVGKDSRYALLMVGVQMRFEVLWDDAIVDSMMSLPHEDESVFAGRIVTLISQYS